MCRDHVLALTKQVDPEQWRRDYNTELYIIGNGPVKGILPFAEEAKYPHTIYTDPSMEVYQALGLKQVESLFDLTSAKESSNVHTGALAGLAWSIGTSIKSGFATGNPLLMGGEFLFGPGNRCHFFHRQNDPHDMTPTDELLSHVKAAAAGSKPPSDSPM